MLGLLIVCWAYLILILLGRVVNYNTSDTQSNIVRIIDNIMIVVLIFIIYFLTH